MSRSGVSDVSRLARDGLIDLRAFLKNEWTTCASIEDCACILIDALHDRLPSVVLVRLYVSIPFRELPTEEKEAAKRIGGMLGVESRITPHTEVLCLLATRGKSPEWNDRRLSQGHRALPLVDDAFVRSAPMLESLFSQVGITSPSDPGPSERVGIDGIFLVEDAASARDAEGRHIVPAQAFVEAHSIKSAFGFGGRYVTGRIMAVVAFANVTVEAADVRALASIGSSFRMSTSRRFFEKRIFSSPKE
jgi:hypothetical protein